MHNSQGGSGMATDRTPYGTPPYSTLLVDTCVGCHSHQSAVTYNLDGCEVPVVYTRGSINFDNCLAGGNFYWVAQGGAANDPKGHNVLGVAAQDNNITVAEGAPGSSSGCTTGCHQSLVVDLSGEAASCVPNTRNGCTGCHMVSGGSGPSSGYPKGYHHADDTDATPADGWRYVESADQGWYRFLAGHFSGDHHGVEGIEHDKWNYGATTSLHNEYQGYDQIASTSYHKGGGAGFGSLGHTMTAYCTGCHGVFHAKQHQGEEISSNPWVRHPSDKIIPTTGEYQYISITYNLNVPVARPSDFIWADDGPSGTVAPGSDMVMCLSCHVPHGSPYDDMLRWDYSDMNAGTTGAAVGTGCFVCHTEKDGL